MDMLNLKKKKKRHQSRKEYLSNPDLYTIIQWFIQINLKYVSKRKEESYMGLDLCPT